MFCKYCGAELESDALFCTNCGKKIAAAASESSMDGQGAGADSVAAASGQADRPRQQAHTESGQTSSASSAGGEWDKASLKKLNPFCIAGCILTVLSLFLIYFGIPALAALIVSAVGFYEAKKNGQNGTALSIICMIVSGVIFVIWLML